MFSRLLEKCRVVVSAVYDSVRGNLSDLIHRLTREPSMSHNCVEVFKNALVDHQLEIIGLKSFIFIFCWQTAPFSDGILSSDFDMELYVDERFLKDLYISTLTHDECLLMFLDRECSDNLTGDLSLFSLKVIEDVMTSTIKLSKSARQQPEMDRALFVFSILQRNVQMSEFFWKRCGEKINLLNRIIIKK